MEDESRSRYPLRQDFRYMHEPIPADLSGAWVVGRNVRARELADRIMLSRGGAFLVSGLRGVGKTTCVQFAIHLIRSDRARYERLDGADELVDVWINLARPLSPVHLLHHLIRHLYLRLKEMNLLAELEPGLLQDLQTAFLRTSIEISSRSVMGEERKRDMAFGLPKVPWLGLELLGKISSSYKTSKSEEEALKFLPYDEKAAEFDILSFSKRLLGGQAVLHSRLASLWHRLIRKPVKARRIKVAFVLDELDKLEPHERGTSASPLDSILQTLKGVFTTSGFSFVFIAGREVEERLLEDVSRGDSIYESIFAHDIYLPCLWNEQTDLLNHLLRSNGVEKVGADDTFALFLRYTGRGVPRRMWREINKYVEWDDQTPVVNITRDVWRYMEVFAKVEESLSSEDAFKSRRGVLDHVQMDRRRLCFYYTIDWIFVRAQNSFSLPQVTAKVRSLNLGDAGHPEFPEQVAQSVVNLLLGRAFLERADRGVTRVGVSEDEARYRLAPWVLLAFAGAPDSPRPAQDAASNQSKKLDPEFTAIGRYQVENRIAEGGFATVYSVRDQRGELYAAKVLRADRMNDGRSTLDLFEREIGLLKRLSHPGIVRYTDSGADHGRPYVIMEWLSGTSLRRLIDTVKTFEPATACAIAIRLAEIFQYVHQHGLVRLDIKPSNVIVTSEMEIKVIDLGIAIAFDALLEPRSQRLPAIGTLEYMAPEHAASGQADVRVDVFSLGVVLFEMLTGQLPQAQDDPARLVEVVDVPGPIRAIILKAIAKEPAARYQSMADMAQALRPFGSTNLREMIRRIRLSADEGRSERVQHTDRLPILANAPEDNELLISEELYSTLYAGTPSEQQTAFGSLCMLSKDKYRLLFDLARKYCLWGSPDGRVGVMAFSGNWLKMGRNSPSVELPLNDLSVSRQHVAFLPSKDHVEVEDLSTSNGTFLNGQLIRRSTLADRDTLGIGSQEVIVHILPSHRTVIH